MKKGVFTIMHYLMPRRGILSLHSGCNMGADKDVTLFFGLSGGCLPDSQPGLWPGGPPACSVRGPPACSCVARLPARAWLGCLRHTK